MRAGREPRRHRGRHRDADVGDAVARRELVVGGGHAGGQLGWTHVGLGQASTADVRVTWPDGEVGPWMTVGANQFVDIERGAAAAIAVDAAGGP